MEIKGKVSVVTGAAGGIGRAVPTELARRGAQAVACVDLTEAVNDVASVIDQEIGARVAYSFVGDVIDPGFRTDVFDAMG